MSINGVYIVQGELNSVVTILRRSLLSKDGVVSDENPLLRSFADLREVLNYVVDLNDMAPSTFVAPFLDVIRSEQTSGPATGRALIAINKFITYGLLDFGNCKVNSAIHQIAEAVTHTRFVGTDPSNDEVVLLRILQVLRSVMLSPVGSLLTDETICEILQSCFRICFEGRLTCLLRKAAESCLIDMVQLLFTRLPTFVEDIHHPYIRRLKMRSTLKDGGHRRKAKKKPKDTSRAEIESTSTTGEVPAVQNEAGKTASAKREDSKTEAANSPSTGQEPGKVVDVHGDLGFVTSEEDERLVTSFSEATVSVCGTSKDNSEMQDYNKDERLQVSSVEPCSSEDNREATSDNQCLAIDQLQPLPQDCDSQPTSSVQFTIDDQVSTTGGQGSSTSFTATAAPAPIEDTVNEAEAEEAATASTLPYGLPCVRELLRFLITLCNPWEQQNTDSMIELALNLIVVALEAGADHLGRYSVLLPMVQDELCRNIISLLGTSQVTLLSLTLRAGFLIFEALRTHLKFQLEMYLLRLMALAVADIQALHNVSSSVQYHPISEVPVSPVVRLEARELALEALVQLWRIPAFVTELYLNYDCDVYCSDLFEEITKLLSKNAFPVGSLKSTHILSLDALLTVVDTIEMNCHLRTVRFKESSTGFSSGNEQVTNVLPTAVSDVSSVLAGTVAGVPASYVPRPAVSGYSFGKTMSSECMQMPSSDVLSSNDESSATNAEIREVLQLPSLRPNRMPIAKEVPSFEFLNAQKRKKRVLTAGTELFNQHPQKGIAFLQENGLLKAAIDPVEVVAWLENNPGLEKSKIAEYVIHRKNRAVLEAFVKSFDFKALPVDEALRLFIESFRMSGCESAEISAVLEQFAEHWYLSNGRPFATKDAAYVLAYAVIMLNMDQHNPLAKRQQKPMTQEEFKANLAGVNGGENFDPEMLEKIYSAVKNEEIVMPAERGGLIKENYLWKVLLKRGKSSKSGVFIHVPPGLNDFDLFNLIWGPTIAALSFVFDKSTECDVVVTKAISGFRKCAAIAAHFGMCDVFDNLIISLCKFSNLLSATSPDPAALDHFVAGVVENTKAQLAAKTMFQLIHVHGDILREGWKNILECLLHCFQARLLPKCMTDVEDFVDPSGRVSILPTNSKPHKSESGLFTSLYMYLGGTSSDSSKDMRGSAQDGVDRLKAAEAIIAEMHPEQLVTDSKYLSGHALSELFKALFISIGSIITDVNQGTVVFSELTEASLLFYLETTVVVALENRDRIGPYWPTLRGNLFSLLNDFPDRKKITERAVVGLLRLTYRLLNRDEVAAEVLNSLALLQLLKPGNLLLLAREIAFGLHQILRSNAVNVHSHEHWVTLFSLLEIAGAAALPVEKETPSSAIFKVSTDYGSGCGDDEDHHSEDEDRSSTTAAKTERGYTSDSEIYSSSRRQNKTLMMGSVATSHATSEDWMFVVDATTMCQADGSAVTAASTDQTCGSLVLRARLRGHDPQAYIRCVETLTFLIRDTGHITRDNFDSCVSCIRTFVEAGLNGGQHYMWQGGHDLASSHGDRSRKNPEKTRSARTTRKAKSEASLEDSDKSIDYSTVYLQLSLQLLDLSQILFVNTQSIFRNLNDKYTNPSDVARILWIRSWRPLLQVMGRLCCDRRKVVRTSAVTSLQRSLLMPELKQISASDWHDAFHNVLFPLLTALLEDDPESATADLSQSFEETRIRAVTMISKVYLQHLIPLSTLASFSDFWITVLDFMVKYYHMNSVDLVESVPESVKNMLLVMKTAGLFSTIDGLLQLTKCKLSTFLPELSVNLDFEGSDDPPSSPSTKSIAAPIPASTAPIQVQPPAPAAVPPAVSPQPPPVPPQILSSVPHSIPCQASPAVQTQLLISVSSPVSPSASVQIPPSTAAPATPLVLDSASVQSVVALPVTAAAGLKLQPVSSAPVVNDELSCVVCIERDDELDS